MSAERKGRNYSTRLFLLGVAMALPWMALCFYEHIFSPLSDPLANVVIFILLTYSVLLATTIHHVVRAPFNSLANIVRSIRHGDYTQRVAKNGDDSVGTLQDEVNQLAEALQNNRLAQMEETFLLQKLVDRIEMPVLVFNDGWKLLMANQSFGRLFDKPMPALVGSDVGTLRLQDAMDGDAESTHWIEFPARASRFMIHRTEFRQAGMVRHLVVLADLKHPLREEERTAWKRLIRVMGHELNNSLTPIISLSQSLKNRVHQSSLDEEQMRAFDEALDVIGSRANHLNHFMQDYSRLAKLPEPHRENVPLAALVQRVVQLENSARVTVEGGPECLLNVDPAQVENLLINIVKNAVDALEEGRGDVRLSWKRQATEVTIWVDDDGPGIVSRENLFVPFFSTKQGGSGIGLVLSREIAEANGGSIDLANRPTGGCRATIALPLIVSE